MMFKLIKKIALLILILVLLDRVTGTVLEKLFYKQQHGDDFVTIQLMDSTKADILILGSSRASHHYISDSLEKYAGMNVYNGGRDNMGIHYIYATLKSVLKRYQPKEIIVDLIPYAFLKGNQDIPKYLDAQTTTLLPFANQHPTIYDDISFINQQETYKAKSIKTYAYNSLIGTIFQNAFTNIGHHQIKGYEPVIGKIDAANYVKPLFPFPATNTDIDTNAFSILKKCIRLCQQNNVKMTIVFSPFYFETPNYADLSKEYFTLQKETNCNIIDFSRDSMFVKNASLFYDELHLNDSGAVLFSKKVLAQLKK